MYNCGYLTYIYTNYIKYYIILCIGEVAKKDGHGNHTVRCIKKKPYIQ